MPRFPLWAKAATDSRKTINIGRIADIICFLAVRSFDVIVAHRPSRAVVPQIHPKTTQY
jgi:hypothetical protein